MGAIVGAIAAVGGQTLNQRSITRRENRIRIKSLYADFGAAAQRFIFQSHMVVMVAETMSVLKERHKKDPDDKNVLERYKKAGDDLRALSDVRNAANDQMHVARLHLITQVSDAVVHDEIKSFHDRILSIRVAPREGQPVDPDLGDKTDKLSDEIDNWIAKRTKKV